MINDSSKGHQGRAGFFHLAVLNTGTTSAAGVSPSGNAAHPSFL
jgi:hypothetical protein